MAELKCPKCGSRDLVLGETIMIVETRSVKDGRVSRSVNDVEPIASKGWTAACDHCGTEWRPRSATVDAARSVN